MRVAFLGTRGVPARYGGFETAVEEIGQRLAASGHEVVVYCRGAVRPRPASHLGMSLVHLPAVHKRSLETLSHTALSVSHVAASRPRFDAAIVMNAANAPLLPVLWQARVPTAVHVDGFEWKRSKWQGAGRRYYRGVEALAVRWADALIADAAGISDYYATEFGAATELLTYGAPVQDAPRSERIRELDLEPNGYHVVVARFEPENHVLEILRGYAASRAVLPLVVVGSAPYSNDYTGQIRAVAAADPRIRLLGGVWDQQLLDQLYAHGLTYVHGHSVGGTNPSLLRAMGAGTAVLAFNVGFNREVLGAGGFFRDPSELATLLETAESCPADTVRRGAALRQRAAERYRWDDVALGYEKLLTSLMDGVTNRGKASGRRRSRRRLARLQTQELH
jgi:glycosyltransferase involved in cell wall biosynthesis